ncbi:hypothetical protein TNCV_1534331 [Trichonephila clavipes]|nr:hypothetical protein TNCV_1534331 [Trichonephila clavipes]
MPHIVRGVMLDQMHLALRKIVNNKSNVRIVAPHTPKHINASSRPGARDSIIDLAVLKNIPFNHDNRDDLESDHLLSLSVAGHMAPSLGIWAYAPSDQSQYLCG